MPSSPPLTPPQPGKKGIFNVQRVIRGSRTVNVSVPEAIRGLHDPEVMIKLNPLVLAYKQDDADPSLWQITDRLEFACIQTTTTFTARFILAENGVDTQARAAGGVYLHNVWRVANGPNGTCEITEEVTLSTNVFLVGFVAKEIEKSHAKLLEALATRLERRTSGGKDFDS